MRHFIKRSHKHEFVLSPIIMSGWQSNYSHCKMQAYESSFIVSTSTGVHFGNLEWRVLSSLLLGIAVRFRNKLSPHFVVPQKLKVVECFCFLWQLKCSTSNQAKACLHSWSKPASDPFLLEAFKLIFIFGVAIKKCLKPLVCIPVNLFYLKIFI